MDLKVAELNRCGAQDSTSSTMWCSDGSSNYFYWTQKGSSWAWLSSAWQHEDVMGFKTAVGPLGASLDQIRALQGSWSGSKSNFRAQTLKASGWQQQDLMGLQCQRQVALCSSMWQQQDPLGFRKAAAGPHGFQGGSSRTLQRALWQLYNLVVAQSGRNTSTCHLGQDHFNIVKAHNGSKKNLCASEWH